MAQPEAIPTFHGGGITGAVAGDGNGVFVFTQATGHAGIPNRFVAQLTHRKTVNGV